MQMNRPGSERIKRRPHIRLSLEHLEHRRLLAGLNVLVFTDQDGSRSLSPGSDVPAASRLVYVDLNRDFQFGDGEPLAISGEDGIARFPNLAPGDYLIGLAGNNTAQVLTTSVVPDLSARRVASAPGSPLTTLIASPDLAHAWSATAGGVLIPVGTEDSDRPVLNLSGRLIGAASGSSAEGAAWVLVDQGQAQPALYRLDYATGSARMTELQSVSGNQRISGIVQAGDTVLVQLTNGQDSSVAPLQVGRTGVTLGQPVAIPTGTLVGSPVTNRVAVLSNRAELFASNQVAPARVSIVQLRGTTASIESIDSDQPLGSLSFSADGQLLFAAQQSGGLKVFTTAGGLKAAAQLAEAAGPVSAGRDGRFVTANASKPDELIVWDTRSWTPAGRVALPAGQGNLVSLAVDTFGERVLLATGGAALMAHLANPAPQSIVVGNGTSEATLGVRLVDRPASLPSRIEISRSTDEDMPLSLELSRESAIRALGAGLIFAPSTGASQGTLLVTPLGRLTYRPQANANGTDGATLRVFDGIGSSTLVITLDVRPVNDPPSSFTVDTAEIDEAAEAGAVAGVATVFDVDKDARYEITTSDSRFVVVAGQVTLAEGSVLDFETEPTIELEITATDLDNPAFVITRRVTVPVLDSNDGPTAVELSDSTVVENTEKDVVGNVVVSDQDQHGEYTYSVSDDRFEFDAGQLRLRSGVILDYETEPVIALTITATDWSVTHGSKSVSSDVTVHVLDSNDAPSRLNVSTNELRSGEVGAIVGRVDVIDQDAADEHKFWVSDERFEVDGNVLRLREGQSVSRDQETLVTMMLTVSDKAGAVLSETVTLNVVNDAPFQNPHNPFDVDNDGSVFPRDALILVNQLNQRGSHVLTPMSASGESGSSIYFLDVNGDGLLTPLDALLLINHINRRGTPAVNNGGGAGGNGSGTSSGAQSPVEEQPGSTPDGTQSHLADGESDGEGEGWGDFESTSCQPWFADVEHERARRDAIDAELERLVDELSRARLS